MNIHTINNQQFVTAVIFILYLYSNYKMYVHLNINFEGEHKIQHTKKRDWKKYPVERNAKSYV